MFLLLKVGISRRCYSGSGIERFHISSPAVSLISSSAVDTLETPCGDHTHLRLISLERNLLYLQLEIVSSQWRAPLLMLPPKHQPPQQACFYHRDRIQACPQTAVSAISACAGELSEVGRLSQKLPTTLPVICWTCYSSREEKQWMKMTEQHDFWGIVKAAMLTADGVRLSCPTHTCHTPPSSPSDARMCIFPYFPHQKQQCHHDTVSSDSVWEVIISSTRWTCVPQHTEQCSDAVRLYSGGMPSGIGFKGQQIYTLPKGRLQESMYWSSRTWGKSPAAECVNPRHIKWEASVFNPREQLYSQKTMLRCRRGRRAARTAVQSGNHFHCDVLNLRFNNQKV